VQRLVCGHLHRSIQARFGGSLAMTAPSPAHQVCLDLAPDAASAWTLEPPGFAARPARARPAGQPQRGLRPVGRPPPFHDAAGLID
jgi:hypothetical protein